ncbi:MAG: oligopeptide/dipeptide ABC transporter ATP-binding protein [bacterium]
MPEDILLSVRNLSKSFPVGGGLFRKPRAWVRAVEQVSFQVRRKESFGLVGESGCGKTTLGRMVLRLIEPSSGSILFQGVDLLTLDKKALRSVRPRLQIIFQDPYSCLDPRMKVGEIITEPLRASTSMSRSQRKQRAIELLEKVGLRASDLERFPHEFSGGQRQRIGIARALAGQPELVVADEPVSALDVSIQAQVLNLLMDLQDEYGLSYLFISHDLSVVEHVCHKVAVMYLGRIVELARVEDFKKQPRHPYTRSLKSSVPVPDPERPWQPVPLEGDVPSPVSPPTGCSFHPRCAYALEPCATERPELIEVGDSHWVACWLNQGRGILGD